MNMSSQSGTFSVELERIITSLDLEKIHFPEDAGAVKIESTEVTRPALALAGYLNFFQSGRIQIFGNSEHGYMNSLPKEILEERLEKYFKERPIASIISRKAEVSELVLHYAKKFDCVLLRSALTTSDLMSEILALLKVELAPRLTRHGVLVEVHGEGVLILGESGVGKSETALELVKRGHRLIADDAVEIRRVSNRTLVGSSPENIRHYMELRGIGIINVREIFGIGAVKVTQQIDMITNLEHWNQEKNYDRMGLEGEVFEILGNEVPCLTIPVRPGRNLSIIIEVAAMNNRQKTMGHNSAQNLLIRLGMMEEDEAIPPPSKYQSWGTF